jgi:CBS domain-containing protein
MKASDIMVRKVVTVGPEDSIRDVASILLKNHISGAPVVDQRGRLIGIVSEGDLLRRPEAGTLRKHSWLAQLRGKVLAAEYVKSHSHKVSDVMTRQLITAAPDTPLDQIVELFEKNGIKRVPITKAGKLIGIVSRANFLKILVKGASKGVRARPRDVEIRKRVIASLNNESWRPSMLDVRVRGGVVDLWGLINSEDDRKAAVITVERTAGVKFVKDNLMITPPVTSLI